MCTVVNRKTSDFDVYIGRGSKWGNPFVMRNYSNSERVRVVQAYKELLWNQIQQGAVSKQDLIELNGKRLGCFCAPLMCHGDEIKRAVEWAVQQAS